MSDLYTFWDSEKHKALKWIITNQNSPFGGKAFSFPEEQTNSKQKSLYGVWNTLFMLVFHTKKTEHLEPKQSRFSR